MHAIHQNPTFGRRFLLAARDFLPAATAQKLSATAAAALFGQTALCLALVSILNAAPAAIPLTPHPDAVPNAHPPGEVDKPDLVPFIVADPASLPGVVVDETTATLVGQWQYSTHTPPYVGLGYLHDQKDGKGAKSVTFTPDLPHAGRYEVRLAHCYNIRRATNTPVTIRHADGETLLRIDQQEAPQHDGLFRTLGTFRFEAGRTGWVRISNEGTEGKYVIADAVQWLPAAAAPYPPSAIIERVEFDWSTHRREAPGSDNWPMTWADDGHQYTAWGDGGGFGGDNKTGRVTLGVARIEGDGANYTGRNVWGGFEPENPAQFGGKSYGILSVGGTLAMWVVPQPGPHLRECRLARSNDHGATWTQADWAFRFDDGLCIPTLLNFGRDYEGARDGYVYSYFIEPKWGPATPKDSKFGFEVHRPGFIHLSRVPVDRLMERDAHEFFAGFDAGDQPRWSANVADKRPVFRDPNGVGWNVSASFNAGLGRYLLATEHGATHAGKFGLFDAPTPWGPWTTVDYDEHWGEGHIEVSAFFWSFPNKWLSADGTRFTMVFTGKNTNDSWNTVAGRFVPRGGGAR